MASSTPSTMKALKIVEAGKVEVREVPLPKLLDDCVLVKVNAVALNPTDWKAIGWKTDAIGYSCGNDFSGVIEAVGSRVSTPWKKGDRIAGFVYAMKENEPESGCFAEYCTVKGDLFPKVPDNVSDVEAATLGVGVTTAGQALYLSLQLPLPGERKAGYPLLVYGGSTASGTLAIQYGVLSGCDVVTTCSPRNFELMKKLGASEVFDYNDPECAKKIREYTKDKLTKVLDCIAEGVSPKICSEAISSQGGEISYLLPAKHEREDVKSHFTIAYTVFGESFSFAGYECPASPEEFKFGQKIWAITADLLAADKIAAHPPKVGKDGLNGVPDGLRQMEDGKVSGVKLVYRIEETP